MTARRNAKAAKAFLQQAHETVRLGQPSTIVTGKTHSYAKVIGKINRRLGSNCAI
ncbi:DDE-type integrase/transposase/recombinase [Leisingera thetidis]|uniref:DDE-type integrase/transposase/recombinase n=1 Tax=Leisingera thetidis TaxID=2930199 RepID=UPI0021F7C709|nr:DDE-type integrase/transposase/recombinase [Leisingera thetidis]